MFDRLYFNLEKRKQHKKDKSSFQPDHSVKSKEIITGDDNRLVVIFPHWHGRGWLYKILCSRLVRKGWSILLYDFDDRILSSDDKAVKKAFDNLATTVSKDINRIAKDKRYKEIHLMGLSLGNVPLMMSTPLVKAFHGATLVLPGDDLAIDMWHGMVTQNLKYIYQKKHIGLEKLDREWAAETPYKYLPYLSGKNIHIFISKSDKIIRSDYQKRMADLLIKTESTAKVSVWHIGHALSLARYCLFGPLPK